MRKLFYIMSIIVMFIGMLGCSGSGGNENIPIVPPTYNPPPPVADSPVVLKPQFVGRHATEAREAFQRSAQNEGDPISISIDLRNADRNSGFSVRERTENISTTTMLVEITDLRVGPLSMWLGGSFGTDYHWAGTVDLQPGDNVIQLSSREDDWISDEYRGYNTLNEIFDNNQAALFSTVPYSRFQEIVSTSSSTTEAYNSFLSEANVEDYQEPRVTLHFDGKPFTANSAGCHNPDSTYAPSNYLEHVIKYNSSGEEVIQVGLDWCVINDEGVVVDCGYSEEELYPGVVDNGIFAPQGSTDYPEGDYTVEYEVVATDENDDILDQEETTVGLTLDLNYFNHVAENE